ncbi:MAG: hypothetical protein ISN26_04125 [Betaproteobacteria bacterium AqS2]|uniref:Glutathione synthetase n=1 Tax=Candidatus Amphirhobacter heronislandensis TaxID=1732024 RepID=A0A930UI02_9GAMM|nr:hypothetical protein [Betaproteobacteria bacterium AqS2]
MQAAYLLDDPAVLDPASDSSLELIRRHQLRSHRVLLVRRDGVSLRGGEVSFQAQVIEIADGQDPWHRLGPLEQVAAAACDLVAIRLEPPVDASYRLLCQMLAYAAAQGVRVWNRPQAILAQEEKLSAFGFAAHTPPSLASSSKAELLAFCRGREAGVMVKPFNSMGGRGVFAFASGADSNIEVALEEILRRDGLALVQERLPAVVDGDRRVFVIDGQPAELMLNRVPKADGHRGNMAAGGQPEAMPLGEAERRVAEAVGPVLKERGVVFAGIDVIGGKLTEINITCPTGLKTVRDQTGEAFADQVIDAMLAAA